jgi:hypothetical protein
MKYSFRTPQRITTHWFGILFSPADGSRPVQGKREQHYTPEIKRDGWNMWFDGSEQSLSREKSKACRRE